MVFENLNQSIPEYTQYPNADHTIFPLSWGFDNEIFYSTMYHEDVPKELQVAGS
jgi:hypothetical protein